MASPESRYINRELSWLRFNARVLEEAEKPGNPLFERLKFLAITASNLDEFFMVRVAGLKEQAGAGVAAPDPSGLTPKEQLRAIREGCLALAAAQYACWSDLLPLLRENGISFLRPGELTPAQGDWLDRYFAEAVYPVLTPVAVDAERPFPEVAGRRITLAVRLRKAGEAEPRDYYALVQVPPILPRVVELPGDGGTRPYMLLEDAILRRLPDLFAGYVPAGAFLFRVTRDADLSIDEDAADLVGEIRRSLQRQRRGAPVRLEYMTSFTDREDPAAADMMIGLIGAGKRDIYPVPGPLDLSFLSGFARLNGFDALRDPPQPPLPPMGFREDEDLFDAVRGRDILVHHPYESFDCVTAFLRRAAEDPSVLAIKQTLYRVGGQSPVVAALIAAARSGKQVTVLVELKARFDEENNIAWARQLEEAGCLVIYGMARLKVHCKALLIVRREEDGIRRYVHLSTGNYNEATARLYSDIGFFTCREDFGSDAAALFNLLTGYSSAPRFRKFSASPIGLREFLCRQIDREIRMAREGRPARVTAKVNSLTDPGLIEKLYEASAAGVCVDLIVRGMCSLRAGAPGLSDNIRVVSVVGRYLEHSRIFCFGNGGKPAVYLSSADWMTRNLDYRVEVCFPVEQYDLKERLTSLLDLMLRDNRQARDQNPDGSYAAVPAGEGPPVSAQETLYRELERHWKEQRKPPALFRPQLSRREEPLPPDGDGLKESVP